MGGQDREVPPWTGASFDPAHRGNGVLEGHKESIKIIARIARWRNPLIEVTERTPLGPDCGSKGWSRRFATEVWALNLSRIRPALSIGQLVIVSLCRIH